MSSSSEPRSPIVRFLDAFLQEENIKWMLCAGVCILLGSSLRLVTTHWHECTPAWKYLILIGYTGVVFLFSEFSYHRLGLRKTGTVLMTLTVLLIPLGFFALHWIRPPDDVSTIALMQNTGLTALVGINLVWSAFAAHRIFRHFLRQVQPTFLLCYLILCVAGAIVPGLPIAWAPMLALALWAVFAAGTVKVNRHVFWLTEEHRLPRIFGFFPILLLGSQFAAVFLFGLAAHIALPWMGLLCTLVAMPILLTANTVARVFEQRTGGLVRPIPWSIIGPLALGTILCISGVVLALTGWPNHSAAVPTAALAAVAMAVMAHRTQKSAFVWGMVLCIIVTYQTSPVFFKEIALQVRDQAAEAVHESRLPYAFYGLTYAPLIVVFSVFANVLRRRGQKLFADPLRITASVLPWVLFGASFTHPSAIFPVGMILCPLFLGQAALFRKRFCLVPSALAFLAVAYGFPLFCQRVWGWNVTADFALSIWTLAAGLLFVPGVLLDRWSRSLDGFRNLPDFDAATQHLYQRFSLLAVLLSALWWTVADSLPFLGVGLVSANVLAVFIGALLACHALRWLTPGLGEITLAYGTFAAVKSCLPFQMSADAPLQLVSGLLLGQWLLSYALAQFPKSRISLAFSRPLVHVSVFGLSVLFGLFVINWGVVHMGFPPLSWITGACLLIWALDASRRFGRLLFASIAWMTVFVFSSAAVAAAWGPSVSAPWWIAVWTATGLGLLLLRQVMKGFLVSETEFTQGIDEEPASGPSQRLATWIAPLDVILPGVFLIVACASLAFFGWPQRCAGLLALFGMLAARRCRLAPQLCDIFWPLVNWQLLAIVAAYYIGGNRWIGQLTASDLIACGLPLAACAAVSAWCFEFRWLRDRVRKPEIVIAHQVSLVVISLHLLAGIALWHGQIAWPAGDIALVVVTWISIAGLLLAAALRTQTDELVWWSEVAMLSALAYFMLSGIWEPTSLVLTAGCLGIGVLQWFLGSVLEKSPRFGILSFHFQSTGFWLPLVTVPLAFWRHAVEPASVWAGANSLPLLAAAAFYFWRGMKLRNVAVTALSAAILNLAAALLWRELHWTDPQLFLMPIGISILALTELLNREIPQKYHHPLQLIGSLVILVSPTFHIVTGSWLHIITLMIAAVAVSLTAIGLRIRTLLYTGSAFLFADLVALVIRGSVDQPNLLWIVGVAIGALVIALGAVCENHRETVLARLRGLAADLSQWR